MGLKRYSIYLVRRTQRLGASPHAIAAGVASGAAVSMYPFIGFHFLLGFGLAFLTRGNMIAAAIGTAVGNPLTFPLIFAASYQIGSAVLPRAATREAEAALGDAEMAQVMGQIYTEGGAGVWPVMQAMIVGGVPLSILAWTVLYVLTRALVVRTRARKAERLAQKRARRAAVAAAEARTEA